MGFLLQRGIFFKNLPNLYINISKNRVIQLYSYTVIQHISYICSSFSVSALTPTCRVYICIPDLPATHGHDMRGTNFPTPTPSVTLRGRCVELGTGFGGSYRCGGCHHDRLQHRCPVCKKCCQGLKQLMMKNACYLQMRWEKRGGQYAIYYIFIPFSKIFFQGM